MYSLRKVLKSGTETNEFIGARYSLVNKDFDPVGFDKLWDGDPDVYAYINDIPLYRDERNYIISSNGALFCNVSYKKRPSAEEVSAEIDGRWRISDYSMKAVVGNIVNGRDITI